MDKQHTEAQQRLFWGSWNGPIYKGPAVSSNTLHTLTTPCLSSCNYDSLNSFYTRAVQGQVKSSWHQISVAGREQPKAFMQGVAEWAFFDVLILYMSERVFRAVLTTLLHTLTTPWTRSSFIFFCCLLSPLVQSHHNSCTVPSTCIAQPLYSYQAATKDAAFNLLFNTMQWNENWGEWFYITL